MKSTSYYAPFLNESKIMNTVIRILKFELEVLDLEIQTRELDFFFQKSEARPSHSSYSSTF